MRLDSAGCSPRYVTRSRLPIPHPRLPSLHYLLPVAFHLVFPGLPRITAHVTLHILPPPTAVLYPHHTFPARLPHAPPPRLPTLPTGYVSCDVPTYTCYRACLCCLRFRFDIATLHRCLHARWVYFTAFRTAALVCGLPLHTTVDRLRFHVTGCAFTVRAHCTLLYHGLYPAHASSGFVTARLRSPAHTTHCYGYGLPAAAVTCGYSYLRMPFTMVGLWFCAPRVRLQFCAVWRCYLLLRSVYSRGYAVHAAATAHVTPRYDLHTRSLM